MRRHLAHIYRLGVKELWSLWRDPTMLFLIVYTFTVAVYTAGTAMPETLHRTPIAIVDEDDSALSARIASAFYPPAFKAPERIEHPAVDPGLDAGRYTLVLVIPPHFQRDVLAGRAPALQLNVDATRMSQAFAGSGFAQQIVQGEVAEFVQRHRGSAALPVELVTRMRFNPTLSNVWFGSLMELVNLVTMLSIILTGAALIREREHGTVEHLLVMPVTPTEIMLAKVWAMALVVLVATALSLHGVIRWALQVPIEGSLALFFTGVALHLFATTSMGIFMATVARSMPQFGLLMVLVMMPLQMLSGGVTPRESMPDWVQWLMSLAPTTHFTEMSQAILYRGAGLAVVWPSFVALALIGAALFALSLRRFRRTIAQLA
ncbi:ABC transporter permease [Aquabacterium sp. A08]|uniref:ABC transporter permease n=1 Tax=Aquabacterium sp. A08 TaxID=2718532 RepID=UPI00141E3E74|nr:ABC transporter permease [Aquabacterium sp. A08]NIC43069.1 ABC-2 transporter permease [Aquabacterium sp. A08]